MITCGEVVSGFVTLSAMEKTATVLVFLSLLALGLTLEIPQVFHVKPTVAPMTECPYGDSPCHSLQYYANHSSFTNNSRFLFLEGEHHLDSVITISNVANLSLVGFSSGVEIVCKSPYGPSGFHVGEFIGLNIEDMAMTDCSMSNLEGSIFLFNGSDVILNHIMITSSENYYPWDGLVAKNVLGAFSIFNSTFFSSPTRLFLVSYYNCDRPSLFNFTESKIYAIYHYNIAISSSDVKIIIENSHFYSSRRDPLGINSEWANSSVVISNSIFEVEVYINMYSCNDAFLKVTNASFNVFGMSFNIWFTDITDKNHTILVEDSNFSNHSLLKFSTGNTNSTSILAVFRNTSFVGLNTTIPVISLAAASVLFINCTFHNNTGSSLISAANSKVYFQGNNTFRRNSALIGPGVQLLESSYIYLEPHTHILFEDNKAGYVGGAIYIENIPKEVLLP